MSLIRHSALNIAGSIIPAAVALPAIGYLARALGAERFGLLTLAWALVGYATLFDLGLSRAVSHFVAAQPGAGDRSRVALGSAVVAAVLSGIVIAMVLGLSGGALADHVFKVTAANRGDAIAGIGVLGLTIPFLLVTLIVQGLLEGKQLFFESNLQKTISGSLLFLLPVATVMAAPTFLSAMAGILIARVIAMVIALSRCNAISPLLTWRFNGRTLRELMGYGGGIALTNTISPIMGYLDRFLLSSIQGAQFVAYYTAAAELVSRLAILPVAISRALFPKLVASPRGAEHVRLLRSARMYTGLACLPPALVLFLFAEQLLRIWLGAELSRPAAPVLKILIVGFAFNAFAQIPFSSIQARGQSYLTAKIQLFEVIPYVIALFYLGRAFGAEGVALAWSARVAADLFIMEFYSRRSS